MNALFSKIQRDEPLAQQGISLLIYTGWAITLLYFPSGFFMFYLGSAVYLRDLALGAHLIATLIWLYRIGDLRPVLRQSAILLLVPLLLIPAVADPEYRFEALRTVKWTFSWLDWILLGHLAFRNRNWNQWLGIFIGLTLAELFLEWTVGAFEWHVGHYLFSTASTWNEHTLFGVQTVKEMKLHGDIRVRGLQRDVFSFANLMAMSAVIGLAWASITREIWQRVAAFVWAGVFAIMLVVSGGRSALFGIFASAVISAVYVLDQRLARRWAKAYVLAWVGIALIISFAGVGQLTDEISGVFFSKSRVGDSRSAYMRDDNWTNILAAFEQDPIILVIGGPIASEIDSGIAPMFHWADNQFLWDAYHLGIAGALAIAFYFFRVLWMGRNNDDFAGMDVIVICLLFVIGEGIARESLTFMGCMPLFLACGYVSADSAAERYDDESPKPRRRRRRKVLRSSSQEGRR